MSSILKVDTIQDSSGNNIINESSNTITIGASGDTTNIVGTLQNNGSSVGGDNTPSFKVNITADQSVTSDTWTKVSFSGATEQWDTDNAFASDKFTCPSGEGGKYFIHLQLSHNSNATTDTSFVAIKFYKNGSENEAYPSVMFYNDSTGFWRSDSMICSGLMNLSAGDYVEAYARIKDLGGGSGPAFGTRIFQGYKLIGV